jgi:glycosyltransferase involved in cell wall biosynthesis
MALIKCKYTGAALDTSGYASACRGYIEGLIDHPDVDLTVGVVSFEQQKTSHGAQMQKIKPYINRTVDHKIHITHLTPQNYPNVAPKVGGVYNVGYTVWETDRLPAGWADLCNYMDEIWVPSDWNIQVFRKCGVTKPIFKVPHIVPVPDLDDMQSMLLDEPDEVYLFYSVFQWIERKNPAGLLTAYLSEFRPEEKVALILKTYRLDCSSKQQQIIKDDVARIRSSLNLPSYPPIHLFGQLLNAQEMKWLHNRGDCFVLPHRGEGFGIPHAEAMSYGKPTVATAYGGNLEFMTADNSLLVEYQETPVTGMIFPNYNATMTWASPNIMDLRRKMRWCFENQEKAKEIGERARAEVTEKFSQQNIATIMVDRLKEIHRSL